MDQYIGGASLHDLIPAILMNLTAEETEKLRDFIDQVLDVAYERTTEKVGV